MSAQRSEDEDDLEESPITDVLDPLASIAESLRALTELYRGRDQSGATDALADYAEELRRAHIEIDGLNAQLGQVLEICKSSTSKLADRIRTVLEPVDGPFEQP